VCVLGTGVSICVYWERGEVFVCNRIGGKYLSVMGTGLISCVYWELE
jgi:hypothetical protein